MKEKYMCTCVHVRVTFLKIILFNILFNPVRPLVVILQHHIYLSKKHICKNVFWGKTIFT